MFPAVNFFYFWSLDPDLDPVLDPDWYSAKMLDPDPKHWYLVP
jgi:hypothetical protein